MASHTGAGRPLRLGLIGSGRIGAVHAASLAAHPGVDFAWVADPFIESARGLAAMYGATATESVEQVLEDRSVDGVILCSPTPTHVDLILAAAERDVAVLCEKPVDLDLERARSCQRAVAGAARPIMIGFNRRFDPSFAAVRRRVDGGEIGRLEQLAITSRDVVVVLIGAGGEQVTITNSRHSAYGYDQRLEAFGAGGMLSAENFRPTSVRSYSSAGTEQADAYEPFFLERYAAAYRAELEHFLRCIREDESATPGIGDGVAAHELAEAAAHSAVTGKTVAVGGAAAVGPAAATRATESRG